MMISGGGPAFTDKRPIEDYTVGSGTAFGAELRNQIDSSLLADVARRGKISLERQAREDAMRRAKPIHKARTFYDAETARAKVKEAGVDYTIPDEGVQIDEFETMLELRKRQRREEITVSRRPKTWLGAGAVLAGDFTAGLVDPINVAASYIPIVGQLRYARWLERAGSAGGRAAVRFGVGAAEGTVGAAVYEGLNLATNRSLPENYGLADSFLNVAFGGVLGGGLHALGGLTYDLTPSRARVLAERASGERRRAALTEAVTAADNGRRVDVAAVFRAGDTAASALDDRAFIARELSRAVDIADSDFASRARVEAGRAPEVRSRAALAEAVEAGDNGRRVDVARVFRRDDPLVDPMADTRFLSQEAGRSIDIADTDIERALGDIQAVRAGQTERTADLVETIKSMGGIRLVDKNGKVTSEGGDVRDIFDKRYPPGLVNNKTGVPLDTVRERLQEDGWLRPWDGEGENPTSINDVLDLLGQWKGGKKPLKVGDAPVEDLTAIREEAKAAGITKADPPEVAAFKLARHRAERAYAETVGANLGDPVVEPDVFDPASDYEPADMADLRGQADEAVGMSDDGAELDGEVDALGEYLNMARTRDRLTADDEAVLALADEFDAKAKRSGAAYKAAAACLSGLA